MSKVTISVGFYLQNQHYAQMEAFLPRNQVLKIPLLKITQKNIPSKSTQNKVQKKPGRTPKNLFNYSQKSSSKKIESEEEAIEEQDQNPIDLPNEQQEEVEEEEQIDDGEHLVEEKIDSEKQEQNLMQYLDDDSSDDDEDLDDDLSSISRSMSTIRNYNKTKRQKGQTKDLMELPDRKSRKNKKIDQATELIRRQQKQRKRKQYLKKQVEAQEKATLDKILNEAGRKLKLREQKENQDQKKKQEKLLKLVTKDPAIITIANYQGTKIRLHNTKLFNPQMLRVPEIKIKPLCTNCKTQQGRYKIINSGNIACSLNCYKFLV